MKKAARKILSILLWKNGICLVLNLTVPRINKINFLKRAATNLVQMELILTYDPLNYLIFFIYLIKQFIYIITNLKDAKLPY